jgi:hypothetical protein
MREDVDDGFHITCHRSMIVLLAARVLSGDPFEGGGRCRQCTNAEFAAIRECHETGFIVDGKSNVTRASCLPVAGRTYPVAVKTAVIFGLVSLNLFLVARIRRLWLAVNAPPDDSRSSFFR